MPSPIHAEADDTTTDPAIAPRGRTDFRMFEAIGVGLGAHFGFVGGG